MASSSTDPATTRKHLALAIIDYLQTCTTDGTLSPDEKDSIEVATNCIADSFKVDATDKAAVSEALGSGQNLYSIFSVYEKLRGKSTASTQGASSAAEARPGTPQTASATGANPPNTTKNAEAENLKGQGNAALQKKDYTTAIDFYTKAIDIQPTNPIYLSNRAAAYSATQQHELAKQDAEMATAADPNYTKAWSRLGLARFAMGDAKGSMEAYKSGIDAEGNGGSDAMKKGFETAKRKVQEMEEDDVGSARNAGAGAGAGASAGAGGMPDLSALAGMFGGGGGGGAGGGGGGMPDLASLMNNPMMRQMANNLMQNPDMMNNLMSNPRLRDMASQYGGGAGGAGAGAGGGAGGGMPDLNSLMNDPSIAEMARNFMGGGGGGGGGGASGADPGAGRGSGGA